MNAVYGDTGFWAWLRYWYLDSAGFVTLMLMDKGYYDYDYEPVKKKPEMTAEQKKIWSKEKLMAVLGTAIDPTTGRGVFDKPKPMTAEEMQRIAMSENADK